MLPPRAEFDRGNTPGPTLDPPLDGIGGTPLVAPPRSDEEEVASSPLSAKLLLVDDKEEDG